MIDTTYWQKHYLIIRTRRFRHFIMPEKYNIRVDKRKMIQPVTRWITMMRRPRKTGKMYDL